MTEECTTEVCLIEERLDENEVITIDGIKEDCLSLECERTLKWQNGDDDHGNSEEESQEEALCENHFERECDRTHERKSLMEQQQ